MDLYRWLLHKHIEPHLGGVLVGKLTTRMVRACVLTLVVDMGTATV
jgi:hypothetical protein